MAITGSQVAVATTATLLADGASASVLVRNAGAASVFLGASGVTTAAGFEVPVGGSVAVNLYADAGLYGITASGTVRVDVLKVDN